MYAGVASTTTWSAWMVYIGIGVFVPILCLGTSLNTYNSTTNTTNQRHLNPMADLSVLALCMILHMHMYTIIAPQNSSSSSGSRFIIPSSMIAIMAIIVFGLPDTAIRQVPTAPDLATGECAPYVSALTMCQNYKYYQTIEPDAMTDFKGTIYSGETRDGALQNGIYQLNRLYGTMLSAIAGYNSSYDHTQALLITCPPLMEQLACAVMFNPCTGDCVQHKVKACRKTCTNYVRECPHAMQIYDLVGPASSLRPLIMPSDVNLNPVYFALDRMFIDLRDNCTNDTRYTDDESACGSESYVPTQEGTCNLHTRETVLRDYNNALSTYNADVATLTQRMSTINHAIYATFLLLFLLHVVLLWIFAARCCCCCCRKEKSSEHHHVAHHAVEFWKKWVSVFPYVVTPAILIQLATIVVVQLAARQAEQSGVYYVCVFEYCICLFEFNVMVDTALCFVRIHEELELNTPKELIPWAPSCIRMWYNRISIYGSGFATRVLVQEIAEVAVQFSYFFVAVSSTDSFTMIASCVVLSLNLCVTPYTMFLDRIYTVMFDVVVEVFYLLFNYFTTFGQSNQWQQRNVLENIVQCASLVLATFGCVLALRTLSQYYFRLREMYTTVTVVVPVSTAAATTTMMDIVPPAEDKEDNDDENEKEEQQPDRGQMQHESPPQQRLQSHQDSILATRRRFFRPVLQGGVWMRVKISFPFVIVGLTFLISTVIRVGVQNGLCHQESGTLLWDRTSPKLLFKDGYFSTTGCHYEVMSEFDLSSLGLTSIPKTLGLYTSVRKLDVTRNRITAVDDVLAMLPLEVLLLAGNDIHYISPAVMDIQTLTRVDVSNNFIETTVDWSHHGLQRIPRGMRFFPRLLSLNVSYNNLTSIDDDDNVIPYIPLTLLDASHNQIKRVTNETLIGSPAHVNLSWNLLVPEGVLSPKSIYMFNQQETLDLSYNNFTDIPIVGFYLSVLRIMSGNTPPFTFKLIGNPLTSFHASNMPIVFRMLNLPVFEDLYPTLVEVDLSLTLTSEGSVPQALYGSPHVRILNMSDIIWGGGETAEYTRSYNSLWRWVTSFPNLETLDLSTSTFDCLFFPEARPYWRFQFSNPSKIRNFVVRMSYPRGFLGPTFPPVIANSLEELDMCLYNGTTLPHAIQYISFPKVKRLYMDWSSFSVEDEDDVSSSWIRVTQRMPRLEVLSLTGVTTTTPPVSGDFLSASSWKDTLQVLQIGGGSTVLREIPLSLTSLVVLNAASASSSGSSSSMTWGGPHPITSFRNLKYLGLGPPRLDIRSGDVFPSVEYLDVSYYNTSALLFNDDDISASQVFPRLTHVCVAPNQYERCTRWVGGKTSSRQVVCTIRNDCMMIFNNNENNMMNRKNDYDYESKFPVRPPPKTWG
eukprot:PhF_6_TR37468/c0_g1_i2/m.55168